MRITLVCHMYTLVKEKEKIMWCQFDIFVIWWYFLSMRPCLCWQHKVIRMINATVFLLSIFRGISNVVSTHMHIILVNSQRRTREQERIYRQYRQLWIYERRKNQSDADAHKKTRNYIKVGKDKMEIYVKMKKRRK